MLSQASQDWNTHAPLVARCKARNISLASGTHKHLQHTMQVRCKKTMKHLHTQQATAALLCRVIRPWVHVVCLVLSACQRNTSEVWIPLAGNCPGTKGGNSGALAIISSGSQEVRGVSHGRTLGAHTLSQSKILSMVKVRDANCTDSRDGGIWLILYHMAGAARRRGHRWSSPIVT